MLNRDMLVEFIEDSNNFEEVFSLVNEVNWYDSSLDFLDYQVNDEEFFNCYFESKPLEAVRATQYGKYNYMDKYVKFNGYGNLESANEYGITQEYKTYSDEIAERVIELENEIDIPAECYNEDEE